MNLTMHPASVSSWGSAAQSIGTDVSAVHTHVRDAGNSGASANMAGFATHRALSSYTDLFEGVVKSVGNQVHGTGTNLVSTANVVSSTDASSASGVSGASSTVGAISARVTVAV